MFLTPLELFFLFVLSLRNDFFLLGVQEWLKEEYFLSTGKQWMVLHKGKKDYISEIMTTVHSPVL